jgi:hypothetical protein
VTTLLTPITALAPIQQRVTPAPQCAQLDTQQLERLVGLHSCAKTMVISAHLKMTVTFNALLKYATATWPTVLPTLIIVRAHSSRQLAAAVFLYALLVTPRAEHRTDLRWSATIRGTSTLHPTMAI